MKAAAEVAQDRRVLVVARVMRPPHRRPVPQVVENDPVLVAGGHLALRPLVQPGQLFDHHVAAVRCLDVTVTHDDVARHANHLLVGSLVVVNDCEALSFRCGPFVPGMAPEVKELPSVACPTVDLLMHARARHLGTLAVGRRAALDRIDVERPRRAQRV